MGAWSDYLEEERCRRRGRSGRRGRFCKSRIPPGRRRRSRDVFADFIRAWHIPWTYFVTLTFREDRTTLAGARAILLRWIDTLPPHLAPVSVVWGVEWHPNRYPRTAHIHALWSRPGPAPEDWRSLKELWFSRAGLGRFFPYDPRRGAAWYVAKYVNKRHSLWGIYERSRDDGKAVDGC